MKENELEELYFDEGKKEYAFNLMVQEYSKRLYWQIRCMVFSHEDANDVLQNTFIKIWKGLPGFKQESSLHTWMYRIANNEALNHIKSSKKYKMNTQNAKDLLWLKDDPYFDGEASYLKLLAGINALPEKQKLIFTMHYMQEVKHKEIASIMKITEGAVKASYFHAVKKIEEFLKSD